MISVQYPSYTPHPFGMMSDHSMHSVMPAIQKVSAAQPFGLGADAKAKHTTAGVKKRPSRAGTRSVSTLTAAQLERKRANDREAQRAIRQRTKDHIDALERQIRELTAGSDPNQKLMQALQRNQELESENALLRSRLNHAVSTMSDAGLNSDHIVLSNTPPSPTRRIKLASQIRTSTTPVPRSIPTPTIPAVHQDWNSAYSPTSSAVDRSPSIADVSPVAASVRWGQQPSQLNHPVHEPDRPMHSVDPSMQNPMGYGYSVDASGRPVQSVQPVPYQSEPQMMPGYTQTTSPAPMNDFHARHNGQPMPNPQTPSYYPAPQAYMPHSPHDADPHMQMMHRQPMDAQPQMMYNMPQNMKAEH